LEGYWVDRSSYEFTGVIYRCGRDTCKGGGDIATSTALFTSDRGNSNNDNNYLMISSSNTDLLSVCWTYFNYNKTVCDDDSLLLCKEGADGPLCGSCKDSYTYNSVLNACEKCGGEISVLFYSVLGSCVVLVFLLFLGHRYYFKSYFRKNVIYQLFSNVDSGSLKVMWVTYQIIISSSFTLNIKVKSINL
jgi:hypothetical protein